MRPTLAILAVLTLAAAARADEIVDVGALLAPVESRHAPRLGTAPLRSGGLHYTFDLDSEEEDVRPVPFTIGELSELLDATPLRPRALLVDAAGAAGLRSLLRDVLLSVRIDVEVVRPDGRIETGEIRARPGFWGRAVSIRRHSLVFDFDPELACDNSGGHAPCVVGDPRVRAALDGLAVQARSFLVDGGRRVALEALVQVGEVTGVETHRTGSRYLGAIELPTYRGAVAVVSGTVATGEPLVARLRSVGGETVVRLSPFVEGRAGAGRVPGPGLARTKPLDVTLPAENAWERAHAAHKPGYGAPPGEAVPLARTVRLDLDVRAGGDTAASASLSALHGRTAFVRIGTDRSLVRDHDVEVGCYVQIADPIVQPVFSGLIVRAVPRVAPDGRNVLLDLTVRVQDAGEPETKELGEPVCSSLQVVRFVDRELTAELVVADGETARLPLGRGADGRPLVLEVRAVAE